MAKKHSFPAHDHTIAAAFFCEAIEAHGEYDAVTYRRVFDVLRGELPFERAFYFVFAIHPGSAWDKKGRCDLILRLYGPRPEMQRLDRIEVPMAWERGYTPRAHVLLKHRFERAGWHQVGVHTGARPLALVPLMIVAPRQ